MRVPSSSRPLWDLNYKEQEENASLEFSCAGGGALIGRDRLSSPRRLVVSALLYTLSLSLSLLYSRRTSLSSRAHDHSSSNKRKGTITRTHGTTIVDREAHSMFSLYLYMLCSRRRAVRHQKIASIGASCCMQQHVNAVMPSRQERSSSSCALCPSFINCFDLNIRLLKGGRTMRRTKVQLVVKTFSLKNKYKN